MSTAEREAIAGIIFAAGKGSRMTGYEGNKTLLPLAPGGESPYSGERPLLLETLRNLPPGPKGIVVHHREEDVRKATEGLDVSYLRQEIPNGTGGALLAARSFLESVPCDKVVITMGDVPLIRPATYQKIVDLLDANDYVVLAFAPEDRAQYGMLETGGDRVLGIVEWKYWKEWPEERQARLRLCNAGVYAARRKTLLPYLDRLAARPHKVLKKRGDRMETIEEYFLTDLVEWMREDGVPIGMVTAPEEEVTGVDTPEALRYVQKRYSELAATG